MPERLVNMLEWQRAPQVFPSCWSDLPHLPIFVNNLGLWRAAAHRAETNLQRANVATTYSAMLPGVELRLLGPAPQLSADWFNCSRTFGFGWFSFWICIWSLLQLFLFSMFPLVTLTLEKFFIISVAYSVTYFSTCPFFRMFMSNSLSLFNVSIPFNTVYVAIMYHLFIVSPRRRKTSYPSS